MGSKSGSHPLHVWQLKRFARFRSLGVSIFPGFLIGLLGGGAQAIATPPYGCWPLAWVALIPLWQAVFRSQTLARTMATAIAWGLTYNAITLHWILALHPLDWMGVPGGSSLAIALACWGIVTLWPSSMVLLWVWLLRRVRQGLERRWGGRSLHTSQTALAFILLGAGLWCLLDSFWSGSPLYWNPIALSQSPHNRAILHLTQWGGPMLIQGLLVGVNGWIAGAIAGTTGGTTAGAVAGTRVTGQTRRRWAEALAVLLLAHGLGGWIWFQSLSGPLPADESLRIGVVQGNIPTRIKLTEEGVQTALERYLQGYRALDAAGAQAVLMPEGAFPFVWQANDPRVQQVNRALGGAIAWIGAFGQEGTHYRQSLFSLEPSNTDSPKSDGAEAALASYAGQLPRYDKVKLVPLGEYIPFEQTLGAIIERLSPLASSMVPGDLRQRFETGLGLAGVQICYEPAFSQIVRQQVAQGAEFILSSANLDPYSEVLMAQSEAHDVMRAIENSRWLARASNTGYSGFIDPQGQVLWRSPPHSFIYHAESIEKRQFITLYSRWGNWITPLLLTGGLLGLWLRLKAS